MGSNMISFCSFKEYNLVLRNAKPHVTNAGKKDFLWFTADFLSITQPIAIYNVYA